MIKIEKTITTILFTIFLLGLFFLRSANAGIYEWSATPTQLADSCNIEIDLYIDTQGVDVNAADVIINYNPYQIQILDADSTKPGTQIGNGVAFEGYYGNIVDTSIGRIRLTGASLNSILNGRKIFAKLNFLVLTSGASSISVQFDGVGNTLDSNIASQVTNLDLLSAGATYPFNLPAGSNCENAPPTPVVVYPTPETFPGTTTVQPPSTPPSQEPTDEVIEPTTGDVSTTAQTNPFLDFLRSLLDLIISISIPGIFSTLLFFLLLLNIINLLYAVRSPSLAFLSILTMTKKKKKPWGIVLDKDTKEPVTFASVRIFEQPGNNLIETKVSDLKGRYGFIVNKGKYKIEVEHPFYLKETMPFNVESSEEIIALDIYMQNSKGKKSLLNEIMHSLKYKLEFLKRWGRVLFVAGFILSIIAVFISPITWNFAVLGGYILNAVALIFITYFTPKNWGATLNLNTNINEKGVHVKIYDPQTWELIDTQITNENGKFGFFLEDGSYAVLAEKSGLSMSHNQPSNLKKVQHQNLEVFEFNFNAKKSEPVKLNMEGAGQSQMQYVGVSGAGTTTTDKAAGAGSTSSLSNGQSIASPFG